MSTAEVQQPQHKQPAILRIGAQVISYICHPVFMPIVMAVTLYIISPNSFTGLTDKQLGLWAINITYNAVFFPLVSIALMKALGLIKSLKMETARERTIPLMASMIFYFWVSHVFNSMPGVVVPLVLKVLLLGNFWGIVVLFMINIFTKISMHTAAAGGMLGIMIVCYIYGHVNITIPFFIALVLAGMIGTARLILHAHERGDVWLGYIIGILVQVGAYLYLK